ncbi:MAG: aminodeoxychorismate/anthranilate synthase component II [Saprospiraceae bacterium]|nr:aminodeoxychorismate/anthranilate synthase component II [Saprospiraceae bacterium]
MKEVLIIDNYDSFTYNLVQLVYECSGNDPKVVKNDRLRTLDFDHYEHVIISPGPGLPKQSGDLIWAVDKLIKKHKVLGICLGLQAIAEVCGQTLVQLETVQHGIKETINLIRPETLIYKNINAQFEVGRYHSWIVESGTSASELKVDCLGSDGTIMGMSHATRPVFGVQFHPESIMTPDGQIIMRNFLNI